MRVARHIALVAVVILVAGCEEPTAAAPWNLPPLPTPLHPSTDRGIALGRRLFFDSRLSGSNTIACVTCHEPELAFTDGIDRSDVGASGVTLARNSPTLANLAWAPSLFWDGGSKNLESFVFAPITNPDEMDQGVAALIAELAEDPTYVDDFADAFPGEPIAPSNVMRAIAQYLRSLVSANSRYDHMVRGEADGRLDARERRGLAVYETHCATCHATDLFTDHEFHNNGLDAEFPFAGTDPRLGRARITFDAADLGKYRTPTLRNLARTAPYMHDGRFATIAEVVEHYRSGVRDSPSLDARLRHADGTLGIPLSAEQEADLVAFLGALEDTRFVRTSRPP